MTQSVIGALRVQLGLDSAQFTRGTRQAEGSLQRLGRSMRNVGLGMTAVGTGIAIAVRGQLNAAETIGRQAQLSNASAEEFQRAAAAARSVGIESDKLADIYKDMSDRVGDFLATGGGPMADFFENIAPQVGLTAENFRDLSGPQALQLFVSSLERAGLSANEMTFYMEAIASDATALLPLLADNGAELNRLADAASRAGVILSEDTIAAAVLFNENLRQLGDTARGFVAILTANLAPALVEVSEFVTRVAEAFQGMPPQVQKVASLLTAAFVVGGPILVGLGLAAMAASALATAFGALAAPVLATAAAVGSLAAVVAVYWDDMQARAQELAAGYATAWASVQERVSTWTEDALQWGADTVAAIGDGLAQGAANLLVAVQALWGVIRDEVMSWPSRMIEIGRDIVQGLINGITERADAAREAITSVGTSLVDGIRNRLGLQSPSRVMMEIGRFISEGLAIGITQASAAPVSAMQSMADQVTAAGEVASQSVSTFGSRFASFVQPIITGSQSIGDAIAAMAGRIGNSLLMSGLEGLGNMLFGGIFGGSGGGGVLSSLFSFSGGGYTGNGPRAGGLDGQGGFLAMMHPREVVTDLTRGGGGGGAMAITVNVSGANGDRHVIDLVQQGVAAGLRQYDRGLPDRVQAIQRDPLARA